MPGLVGSWAANQFHSFWSKMLGEEQTREVAERSDRGGRPDTAAAKRRSRPEVRQKKMRR